MAEVRHGCVPCVDLCSYYRIHILCPCDPVLLLDIIVPVCFQVVSSPLSFPPSLPPGSWKGRKRPAHHQAGSSGGGP